VDAGALERAVEAAFALAGAAAAPWPDPHATGPHGGVPPREDEYSRCLQPARYRIVVARAEAWAQALLGLGLAVEEPLGDPARAWADVPPQPGPPDGRWLLPGRPGALPLLLAVTGVAAAPRSAVVVGADRPAVRLVQVPACGCDACDAGSDDLLAQLDEAVLDVVTGGRHAHLVPRTVAWG
jgi:hypothetical protein